MRLSHFKFFTSWTQFNSNLLRCALYHLHHVRIYDTFHLLEGDFNFFIVFCICIIILEMITSIVVWLHRQCLQYCTFTYKTKSIIFQIYVSKFGEIFQIHIATCGIHDDINEISACLLYISLALVLLAHSVNVCRKLELYYVVHYSVLPLFDKIRSDSHILTSFCSLGNYRYYSVYYQSTICRS